MKAAIAFCRKLVHARALISIEKIRSRLVVLVIPKVPIVTGDDLRRQFSRATSLQQCCDEVKHCRNNVCNAVMN